jgi:hypothetical protein
MPNLVTIEDLKKAANRLPAAKEPVGREITIRVVDSTQPLLDPKLGERAEILVVPEEQTTDYVFRREDRAGRSGWTVTATVDTQAGSDRPDESVAAFLKRVLGAEVEVISEAPDRMAIRAFFVR